MVTDRDKMIENNIGLVHSIANRFKGRGVDYDDLFQSGCVGLIKAVDNFDESRGFAFSTYAVFKSAISSSVGSRGVTNAETATRAKASFTLLLSIVSLNSLISFFVFIFILLNFCN